MPKVTNFSEITDKELIGRSVYGKKPLDDEGNLKWDHFYDSRLNDDLSVDRVGVKDVCNETLHYLKPLAETRKENFKGWAIIKVQKIKSHAKVYPDPIDGAELKNKFHAQIDRSDYRNQAQARTLAVALSHLAKMKEFPEAA